MGHMDPASAMAAAHHQAAALQAAAALHQGRGGGGGGHSPPMQTQLPPPPGAGGGGFGPPPPHHHHPGGHPGKLSWNLIFWKAKEVSKYTLGRPLSRDVWFSSLLEVPFTNWADNSCSIRPIIGGTCQK